MAIEAVIWDFGGVFTTSPFEAFNRYEAAHGVPLNRLLEFLEGGGQFGTGERRGSHARAADLIAPLHLIGGV